MEKPHSSPGSMLNSDSERDLMGFNTPRGYVAPPSHSVPRQRKSKKWWWIGGIVALLIVIGAVLGGVLGTQLNKNKNENINSSGANGDNNGSGNGNSNTNGNGDGHGNAGTISGKAENGADGSKITSDAGDFTYVNKFGGSWAVDPQKPFETSGQAQDFTPKIGEKWTFGKDIIRGVNLGGWLVTEPFIVPGLYEAYQNATPQAVDEFTLSQAMGDQLAEKMEEHYKTFITEQDFAEITEAGLNWVRIPLGYWAIQTVDGEPYLEGVSWKYFVKAIGWARKYGLRILLDLHALPGSQNGWNHSGRGGTMNWMYGTMGIANAERSLEIIRSMVQFISQPGIKEVVPMISLVNELPLQPGMTPNLNQTDAGSFYLKAYDMIREITGTGDGNGPIVVIHDGFLLISEWKGFLAGADRLAIDQHLYLAFGAGNQNPRSPLSHVDNACSWGGGTNDTQSDFGITIGGEWSLAISDCGKWLNGVQNKPSYDSINKDAGGCKPLDEWMNYDQEFKDGLREYMLASMDALQNFFFWTWRIGNSTEFGYPTSPFWHYRLGWKEGWIPADPREAGGYCQRRNKCPGCAQFDGNFPASATGGVASATIAAGEMAKYPWPPAFVGPSFAGEQVKLLPTLTQTGTPITLSMPTPTPSGAGNGWAYPNDKVGAYVPVNGCEYPFVYDGEHAAAPTAVCTGK